MPQIKARSKHIRQTEKRTRRNRRLKKEVARLSRAVMEVARRGDEQEIHEALSHAYKAIDKASKVGAFPSQRGDRKKSVLARQVAELQAEE